MTAINTQAAEINIADDMALLNSMLGDDAELDLSLGEIDLSLEAAPAESANPDDALLDELLANTAESITVEPAAAEPAAAASSDADDDVELDLNLDEDALLQAALEAEGVSSTEELPAAPEAAPAPVEQAPKKAAAKKPSTARTTYTNSKASEVLKARLNGDVSSDLILELSDLELSPEELQSKQSALLDILNVRPHQSKDASTQKKVAEKVVMLFGYLKNGGNLNEVLRRTFTVLAKDGYVQMGKTGNLFLNLLEKPYSVGTANAQGGQMLQMLPLLKIALPDPSNKGRLVVNPNSVIFARMVTLLGLDKAE